MMDFDTERAEESLNRLIEARALEREEANHEAEAWEASERRYTRSREQALQAEWAEHYRSMIRVHEGLAERARQRLLQLIDEGARS